MGEREFYFKFYAGDFLLDEKVDMLPDPAQLLLVKMWCLCCIHGYAPSDPVLLSKRVKMDANAVHLHLQSVMQFFYEPETGRLMSPRMEEEMQKSGRVSRARQKAAKSRWDKKKADSQPPSSDANANADANADANRMQLELELELDNTSPKGVSSANAAGAVVKVKAPRNKAKEKAKANVLSEDVLPWLEYSWNLFPTNYEAKDGKVRNLRLDRIKVEKLWLAILGGAFDSHLGGVTPTAEELACAAQVYLLSPHPRVKDGFASEIAVFYSISERSNSSNLWAEAVLKVRERRAKGQSSPPRPFDGTHPLLPKAKIHSDDPGAILAQPGHTPIIPLQEGFTLPEAITQV